MNKEEIEYEKEVMENLEYVKDNGGQCYTEEKKIECSKCIDYVFPGDWCFSYHGYEYKKQRAICAIEALESRKHKCERCEE